MHFNNLKPTGVRAKNFAYCKSFYKNGKTDAGF